MVHRTAMKHYSITSIPRTLFYQGFHLVELVGVFPIPIDQFAVIPHFIDPSLLIKSFADSDCFGINSKFGEGLLTIF